MSFALWFMSERSGVGRMILQAVCVMLLSLFWL